MVSSFWKTKPRSIQLKMEKKNRNLLSSQNLKIRHWKPELKTFENMAMKTPMHTNLLSSQYHSEYRNGQN